VKVYDLINAEKDGNLSLATTEDRIKEVIKTLSEGQAILLTGLSNEK